METNGKPVIFVTVGTDHHPFGRLVSWTDNWLEAGGEKRARCFVQRGTSPSPRLAEAVEYVGYDDMERLMTDATVVVTHGGPGSIMQAAALGKRPLVIPRRRDLGEHVDDHQVAFARRLAREGSIELAETEEDFRAALELGASGDLGASRRPEGESVEATVERFEGYVSALFSDASPEDDNGRGS
jgi:UDP-N-acetylglucosamine transferase subunit ALG13